MHFAFFFLCSMCAFGFYWVNIFFYNFIYYLDQKLPSLKRKEKKICSCLQREKERGQKKDYFYSLTIVKTSLVGLHMTRCLFFFSLFFNFFFCGLFIFFLVLLDFSSFFKFSWPFHILSSNMFFFWLIMSLLLFIGFFSL